MSQIRTPYIHQGSCIDYNRPWTQRPQWLFSDDRANILTNLLAVLLTLATQRCFLIIRWIAILGIRLAGPARLPSNSSSGSTTAATTVPNTPSAQDPPVVLQPVSTAVEEGEDIELDNNLGSRAAQTSPRSRLEHPFEQSETAESAAFKMIEWVFGQIKLRATQITSTSRPNESTSFFAPGHWKDVRMNFAQDTVEKVVGFTIGVLLLTLYASFTALSILSALVSTDSVALSDSPFCGLFISNDSDGFSLHSSWRKYYRDIEAESSEYARKCYHAESGEDGCNFFYQQSIKVSTRNNDACLFGNHCLHGLLSAFTVRTRHVPVQALGINTL